MSFKTILVHLADDAQHRTRLMFAHQLARQHDAHVMALFLTRPQHAAIPGRGASSGYLAEMKRAGERKADALHQEFDRFCTEAGLRHSWIVEDGDHLDLLRQHAHIADLAIVSRAHPEHLEDHVTLQLPEHMTVAAGCPAIVVPDDWTEQPIGRNVMIAFKLSRESARATRCALPMLTAADTVTVLTIGTTDDLAVQPLEVLTYLRRHGIEAGSVTDVGCDGDAGDAILGHAGRLGADMIVMGAYGHSKLHEFLWGGATRTVFAKTTVPLFVSH